MGLSGLCSPHGHSRQFGFRSTVSHASTFLSPFAPRPLRRFSARMRTVTPRGVSLHPLPRSPRFTSPIPLRPFCLQPPHAPHRRFCTLPLSSMGFPRTGLGFATVPQARRDMRPNRVRPPADWSLTSGCSPPRLTATQFPSVSGRRAFAWRGLAPLWMSALTGARNAGVPPAGGASPSPARRPRAPALGSMRAAPSGGSARDAHYCGCRIHSRGRGANSSERDVHCSECAAHCCGRHVHSYGCGANSSERDVHCSECAAHCCGRRIHSRGRGAVSRGRATRVFRPASPRR